MRAPRHIDRESGGPFPHLRRVAGRSNADHRSQRHGRPNRALLVAQGGIADRSVQTVIIDNIASTCAGNINDPRYATRALSLLAASCLDAATSSRLAHVDKALAKSGYGAQAYSGTAAWHNRSRWRWYLYAPNVAEDKEEDGLPEDNKDDPLDDDGSRVLEVQKNNAGEIGQRIMLHFVGPRLVPIGTDGIVASIERGSERRWILRQIAKAQDKGDPILRHPSKLQRARAPDRGRRLPEEAQGQAGKTDSATHDRTAEGGGTHRGGSSQKRLASSDRRMAHNPSRAGRTVMRAHFMDGERTCERNASAWFYVSNRGPKSAPRAPPIPPACERRGASPAGWTGIMARRTTPCEGKRICERTQLTEGTEPCLDTWHSRLADLRRDRCLRSANREAVASGADRER